LLAHNSPRPFPPLKANNNLQFSSSCVGTSCCIFNWMLKISTPDSFLKSTSHNSICLQGLLRG
jgi:hypothetical protein